MDYEIFVTPGLGDNSYLVVSDGEAVIVDPQRDTWRLLAVTAAHKWRLRGNSWPYVGAYLLCGA